MDEFEKIPRRVMIEIRSRILRRAEVARQAQEDGPRSRAVLANLSPLRSVLAQHRPALHLTVLGALPGSQGVPFPGVAVTESLLTLHARTHQALAGQPVTHWPYYLPGHWVPHCTLAQGFDKDEIAGAFRLLPGHQFISAQVTSARVTATGTVISLTR